MRSNLPVFPVTCRPTFCTGRSNLLIFTLVRIFTENSKVYILLSCQRINSIEFVQVCELLGVLVIGSKVPGGRDLHATDHIMFSCSRVMACFQCHQRLMCRLFPGVFILYKVYNKDKFAESIHVLCISILVNCKVCNIL